MLTAPDLDALRASLADRPRLGALLDTLRARAAPVLRTLPPIPRVKAMLSRDGGVCPSDGAPLRFDPWSPERHACPRCGRAFEGPRHHAHWARPQHLWLAERAAELALLAAVDRVNRRPAAARAVELLRLYEDLYFELPNRDNVLGPSHLFFSTYLESLWLTSCLAAAFLLREAELLPDDAADGVSRVAEEAAALIGEFNEGHSNRQTWHAAALTAIAAWFGDEELARSAVESRTGLLGHLADGFGGDGLWWEGENYHLFALRGLMQGIHWARAAGLDLLEDADLRTHFRAAVLAPSLTALPDCTYPARRDSRYGVSLAQPPYQELFEIGRAWLGPEPDAELDAWLAVVRRVPFPHAAVEHYDAWLHDAGAPAPARAQPRIAGLSWWALAAFGAAGTPTDDAAGPTDDADDTEKAGKASPGGVHRSWMGPSVLLPDQGLAVLRGGGAYASLECGPAVGGHGHPDRLHLTLFAGGVHWLPDQGTGSYVQPHLAWYRSALAHNAPLADGHNAGGANAWCEAFDAGEDVAWCRGRAGELRRTVVTGPGHLVDVLELEAGGQREVILPWHFQGDVRVESPGRFEPAALDHPFVSRVERFVPAASGPVAIAARVPEGDASTTRATLRAFLLAPGAELLRAVGPGLPTEPGERLFLLLRGTGHALRWVAVLDWSGTAAFPDRGTPPTREATGHAVRVESDAVVVDTRAGPIRYRPTEAGLSVESTGASRALGGLRPQPARRDPLFRPPAPSRATARAPEVAATPALDGTLGGFDTREPLALDDELQYRRSEEPYDPERFTARAWVNWRDGDAALYVAVLVAKPDVAFRAADAPPLDLDNEADDIHSDGFQLYARRGDEWTGSLVVPQDGGGLRARDLGSAEGGPAVTGCWSPTPDGYRVTLRLEHPLLTGLAPGERLGFDLLINEMQPDRLRRAGQLVWGGDGGWVYLRGDRHDPARFGVLELG